MSVPHLEPPAARHWDFPRSVAGLALLVDFAAERGVPRDEVLRGLSVVEAVLTDSTASVAAADELCALRNLVRALPGEPGLGLELGRRYHVTSFGILGYALMSSRTVLDAMNLALRFLDLSYVFSAPVAEVDGDEVAVRLDARHLPADLARFLVERDASAIGTVLAELVPEGVPFSSVELASPAPVGPTARHQVEAHVAALGVVPRFGCPETVLRFDVRALDLRLPQANPHSRALAEAMCRDVVSRRRGEAGLVGEVRLWLTRNVAYDPAMARAAAALATSPRTLRRRLAEAGTSFQRLLDEVRRSLAEEMLATEVLDVEDIAQRLGYAEASSFIHAFKRWHGVTPTQFRGRRTAAGCSAEGAALHRDALLDQ